MKTVRTQDLAPSWKLIQAGQERAKVSDLASKPFMGQALSRARRSFPAMTPKYPLAPPIDQNY
jgi:hypothetical protein